MSGADSTPGEEALKTADLAMHEGGEPAQMIARFHQALPELTGRRGVRNDVSRYEAIALALVDPIEATRGNLLLEFPPEDSPLRFERFFSDLSIDATGHSTGAKPLWTEDADFFGAGVATWTTDRVELLLREAHQRDPDERETE